MRILAIVAILLIASFSWAAGDWKPKMDSAAKRVKFKDDAFTPDPAYEKHEYNPEEQLKIYGGKYANDPVFYLHIFGRRLYPSGTFDEGLTLFGRKNRMNPHLHGFGDFRMAYAYSDTGGDDFGEGRMRLNLDLDLKLTATERFHAFVRPLDRDGNFTGVNRDGEFEDFIDFNLETLFFEGDVASIWQGITGEYSNFDLPFAVGLMPILFQNGIWINDTFTGAAFTIPARNSAALDISNMDFTVFAGFDELDTAVGTGEEKIYGFNWFVEAMEGYFEIGYAYTDDGVNGDLSYHNAAFAFSHRYHDIASLSWRVIGNFGQEGQNGTKTADGALFLIESSWMTHLPYTLIPYANFFYGKDKPQSVARAGGILLNTGILFEADGLTSFPTLEASGNDTWGGALGIEYIFNLDQQIVFEIATVNVHGDDNIAADSQYGVGVRWQLPFYSTWILRMDAMYAHRVDDTEEDLFGGRVELRWKF